MKNKIFIFIMLFVLCLHYSCQNDDGTIIQDDDILLNEDDDADNNSNETSPTTFGIRHDKDLSAYEALANSTASDDPNFEAVVAFSYSLDGDINNAEFIATGTIINQNWILTAGHNFFTSDDQSSPAPVSGIEILVGNNPNDPDAIYEVEQLVFHPTWLTDDRLFESANDLCLVKLKNPITNISSVQLFTNTSEQIGSKVWYCGFGDYSQTAGQNSNDFSKKHVYENILDRKINGITTSINGTTYNGGLLAYDFDDPAGNINSLGDNIVNIDEALLGSGNSEAGALEYEAGSVAGDSGGPLFVLDEGIWKLAGVLSGGAAEPINNFQDGNYGDISFFIRVSSHIDWINSVVE